MVVFPQNGQPYPTRITTPLHNYSESCFLFFPAANDILTEGTLDMEVIINHKHLDSGLNIIQLEQAVGAAIKSFNGAHGKYENLNEIGVSWESNYSILQWNNTF